MFKSSQVQKKVIIIRENTMDQTAIKKGPYSLLMRRYLVWEEDKKKMKLTEPGREIKGQD